MKPGKLLIICAFLLTLASVAQEQLRKANEAPDSARKDTTLASSRKARPQFWYEDNNVRRAGGYPPDFQQMWEDPDSWKEEVQMMQNPFFVLRLINNPI